MTIFLRLLAFPADKKGDVLLGMVGTVNDDVTSRRASPEVFEREPRVFGEIPGSSLAYWISRELRSTFSKHATFESDGRVARRTNGTTDDGRWIRLSWEVQPGTERWIPHAKGGAYSEYYADLYLVIGWDPIRRTYPGYLGTIHRPDIRPASLQYFFRPGLTWSRRTQKGFSMRALPRQSIFGDKGPGCFVEDDSEDKLLAAVAITNSCTFRYLLGLQMAFGSYEAGVVQSTPYPEIDQEAASTLAALARKAWSQNRQLDTVNETSHAFVLPAPLARRLAGFDPENSLRIVQQVKQQIDKIVFSLYPISLEDQDEIERAFTDGSLTEFAEIEDGEIDSEPADDEGAAASDDPMHVLSWSVGLAFGRFDARLATGERAVPPEPGPFYPLPAVSPGMWPAEEARPAPTPDLLVDDAGHTRDITSHVIANAELVGLSAPADLRQWLAREFFSFHIKMYSKSRRKAPIYWQLATPSASYSIWLYIHAFTSDTMFRVQNDYVVPKLRHEESRLETIEREAGERASAAQRKAIADQEAFVEELRGFLDEVKRVAPLWNPDLDDGVIINFAPLWRLVPHHRPWQKELKATWDALGEGKYDWAHLAMRLWPERVVPKCATDRSLAIAHGLEEVFWAQGSDGRWKARTTPTRPIDEVVAERASQAVKAALRSLLDAPDIARGRAGRKRSATKGSNRGGR